MVIEGGYNQENFSYIRIDVKRCQPVDGLLDESGNECASQDEIRALGSLRVYLPEATINYETRDTDKAIGWNLNDFIIL